MYNNTTNNQQKLKFTSSSMVPNFDNKKNVPELIRHSESPELFEMPKTPSIHTFDDTAIRPILKQQESTLSTDNLFTSLKSAIRRIHPDELVRLQKQKQQKDQYHDRVIITRASTTTTTDTSTTHNNPSPLFSIPTIPERRRRSSLLDPNNNVRHLSDNNNNNNSNNNNNASVSSFTSHQTTSSLALSAIPLTENSSHSIFNENNESSFNNDDILLKGRLLCAIHMEWYSRRHFTTNETSNNNNNNNNNNNHLRLRQSRLRWREFEAVLKVDRLELYLVTNLVIKRHRLAHVIYLKPNNNKKKSTSFKKHYNPVKLTLVSPVDFIWSLQFRSCDDRNVNFLFVSRTIRESQTWYMALYRRPTTKTTPIPALIDLYIPALDNLQIRLPLANLDFKDSNIRIQHVLHCALTLLDRQGIKPIEWRHDNVSICWRFGKHDKKNNNSRLEWIPHDGYLLSPHLIEQTHTLELRSDAQQWRQHPRQQLPPPIMEGEFLYYNSQEQQQQQQQQQQKLYGMMEGQLLFLLDPLKVIKPPEDILNDGGGGGNGRHHTRFTWARSLFTTQILHVRSLTRFFRPTNTSVTSTARHAAQIEFNRRVANIMNALTVIDMSRVTKVRRVSSERPTTFEINIDNSNIKLQFEVSTMHSMFEWIQRIQKIIHDQREQQTSLSQPFQEKSILYSGILYVRQDYLCTFKRLFCILTREKKLVLYNTCQVWNEHFITLSLDQQVYVYNANDDQAVTGSRRSELKTRQPPRIFSDGNVMTSSKTEDCTFVIWQTTHRHILATLRERLSTFKFGHRLGRKGSVWVCLARNQDEKEAWVSAIHQAIDQIS